MPPNKFSKVTSGEQHARFIETARALGCDEDEAAFDEKLRRWRSQTRNPRRIPQSKD
jgi:hypothetical protein